MGRRTSKVLLQRLIVKMLGQSQTQFKHDLRHAATTAWVNVNAFIWLLECTNPSLWLNLLLQSVPPLR